MRLLMQHIRDLSLHGSDIDGTDCYLLLVLRCWSSSNGTSGLIPKSVHKGLLFLARASSVNVISLVNVGLLTVNDSGWVLTQLKDTPKVSDEVEIERILTSADQDPERIHWRSCLKAQEHISNPTNVNRWRLAVLKNWVNGVGTPSQKQMKSAMADDSLDRIAELLLSSNIADGLVLPKEK